MEVDGRHSLPSLRHATAVRRGIKFNSVGSYIFSAVRRTQQAEIPVEAPLAVGLGVLALVLVVGEAALLCLLDSRLCLKDARRAIWRLRRNVCETKEMTDVVPFETWCSFCQPTSVCWLLFCDALLSLAITRRLSISESYMCILSYAVHVVIRQFSSSVICLLGGLLLIKWFLQFWSSLSKKFFNECPVEFV